VSPSFSADSNHVTFAWNPSETLGQGKFDIWFHLGEHRSPAGSTSWPRRSADRDRNRKCRCMLRLTATTVPPPELRERRLTANPADNPAISTLISPDGEYLTYSDLWRHPLAADRDRRDSHHPTDRSLDRHIVVSGWVETASQRS
jgi:hypothetical protein